MVLANKGIDTLSIDLAKEHLVVEHALDDVLINSYIDATLVVSEGYLSRPITEEAYTSVIADSYEIKYKPTKIDLYLGLVLVEEDALFRYDYPNMIISTTVVYDNVKTTIESAYNKSVEQSRLLTIGSFYRNRENEDYSNMKDTGLSSKFLLDLNEGAII